MILMLLIAQWSLPTSWYHDPVACEVGHPEMFQSFHMQLDDAKVVDRKCNAILNP